MSAIVLSVAFLLVADQPPATPAPEQTAATTAQAPAEEPKMVCKKELETGSRVKRVMVCRPEGQKEGGDNSALLRQLDKVGSTASESVRGGGIGN